MWKEILAVVLGLSCAASWAESPALTWQSYEGTVYLTGGVGEEDLEAINQARGDFNLRVLMAEKSGTYVTGVRVVVVDGRGGTVLDVPSAGPYLLVRLPAGSYQLNATYEERSLAKRFAIKGDAPQMIFLYW